MVTMLHVGSEGNSGGPLEWINFARLAAWISLSGASPFLRACTLAVLTKEFESSDMTEQGVRGRRQIVTFFDLHCKCSL